MNNENELEYVDMTDEQLADYNLKQAIEYAKITLQLAENCYRKFGKQLLSDTQKEIFQMIAAGELPSNEQLETLQNEEIRSLMETIKREWEVNKQASAKLGKAYEPELAFQDKSDGFAVN